MSEEAGMGTPEMDGSGEATDTLQAARDDLAAWAAAGSIPWDLPASAVHFALDCHGCESNPVGTEASLHALTDECEECSGEGYFETVGERQGVAVYALRGVVDALGVPCLFDPASGMAA